MTRLEKTRLRVLYMNMLESATRKHRMAQKILLDSAEEMRVAREKLKELDKPKEE